MTVINAFLALTKPMLWNLGWVGKRTNIVRKLSEAEYDELMECSRIILVNRKSGSDFMRAITSVSLTNVENEVYTVMISWYDTGVRHL